MCVSNNEILKKVTSSKVIQFLWQNDNDGNFESGFVAIFPQKIKDISYIEPMLFLSRKGEIISSFD